MASEAGAAAITIPQANSITEGAAPAGGQGLAELAGAVPIPAGGQGGAVPLPLECDICCEPFNNSSRKCIDCEHVSCGYKICSGCIRAYLLTSTNEPHCMECKQPWTAKFMLQLTKKWMTETYKPHREKLLCDVELSKIPETMAAAERYKAIEKEKALRQDIREKIKPLQHEIEQLKNEMVQSETRQYAFIRGGGGAQPAEKKVFFMSCPADHCNGMLSTQYKCGICEMFTCPACHEIIGAHKTDEHTCDPNDVASAEAIKKETKQCPGCHNRIYRIEGCSQMWCTGCHTAFDWNTGRKVVSGQLHNPHWVEYQRSLNPGGQALRAPGDVPCGGLVGMRDVMFMTAKKLPHDAQGKETLLALIIKGRLYRLVADITTNEIRTLRAECQAIRDFEQLRIRYIIGEKTKEEMATHIYRCDRKAQKNTELLHIYELLGAVGIDLFQRLMSSPLKQEAFQALAEEQLAQYNALRIHCNGLFAIISNTYNQTVPQIDEGWQIVSKKFNSKTMAAASASAS